MPTKNNWTDEEIRKLVNTGPPDVWVGPPSYFPCDLAKGEDATFEITYKKKWRYRLPDAILSFLRSPVRTITRRKPKVETTYEHPYFKYKQVIRRIR